jgi:phosphoglycerate kinase
MRNIKSVKSIGQNLRGKKVLVRVDFNVPIKNGKVEDDFRIVKALPTIKFLLQRGAKIILITHLGEDGKAALDPVIKHFFKISKLSKKDISFFDNVRKFEGEMKNDQVFAKKMAQMGDLYVNEAFSVSHRTHASVVSLPKYLPSFAGFQFEKEIKNLSRVLVKTRHPFLFILGGVKFSTKMPLIKKYLQLADNVFVGGALANNFFQAQGYEIGRSVAGDSVSVLKSILKNKKLILPEDVFVKSGNKLIVKRTNEIEKNEEVLDVGNETVGKLKDLIQKSKIILWNGPLGKYEEKNGALSTKKILKMVASAKAESIVGGGDTVALISKMKMEKKFSFVSTGGGATLDFLVYGTLPGIKALK